MLHDSVSAHPSARWAVQFAKNCYSWYKEFNVTLRLASLAQGAQFCTHSGCALAGKIGMGVPKQRKTKSRQGNRRSHHALKIMRFSRCGKCGKEVLPHRLCENCGNYNKREVVNVLAKLDKKERKRREREQAMREKETEKQGPAPAGNLEELSKK